MSPTPDSTAPEDWHRYFAVECNNAAWDLFSRHSRTAEDDRDMLYNAYAAAYHWRQVGEPLHHARADVTLAHALSLAGQGKEALEIARRALRLFEQNPGEDWDIAFAQLEMSLAAYTLGDESLYRAHYQQARHLGAAISGDDDRAVFQTELARIPAPG